MKSKDDDLYDLTLGFSDLADKELSRATSLKVYRNQKSISEEMISSDKIRQKIIEEHTVESLDDRTVKLDETGIKKINELMNQEIEIDLQKLTIEELKDIKVKPKTLNMLKTILNAE